MPTPLEFIERVMPWPGPDNPGYVNLHWTSPRTGNWRGRPFKNAADFIRLSEKLAVQPAVASGVYFCLTLQSETGKPFQGTITAKRSAENAISVKALWLDIDVKADKGYPTLGAALTALEQFLVDAKLPPATAIVLSGGGLHVYWISDVPIPFKEWKNYAEGLKKEIKRLGFLADNVYDGARVLRVPGTFNRKLPTTPREVRLANVPLGADIDFGVSLAHLAELGAYANPAVTVAATTPPPFDLTPFVGKKPAALLATGKDPKEGVAPQRDDTPFDPIEIFAECPMFRDAAVTNGADHGQGLWALVLLASTFWDNGRRWAHYLSKGHKDYGDGSQTNQKLDEKLKYKAEKGLGWPSCKSFEGEGSKQCATCVYKGKIRSPLNLAVRKPPQAGVNQFISPPDMKLPKGYVLNKDGIVCARVEYEEDGGETTYDTKVLFHGILSTPWREEGRGTAPVLHFQYRVGNHVHSIRVPDGKMSLDFALFQCLGDQGCKTVTANQKYVVDFMKSWATILDEHNKRQTSVPFGWVNEGGDYVGFAYGGKIFKSDGSEELAGHPDPRIADMYTPQGSPDHLLKLMDITSAQKHWALEVILLQSFAAPLLYVTGEDAGVLWAWSNQSGAHKSTSALPGLAVWGDPKRTKENAGASPMGLEAKLGQIRNLPVIIDEIQKEEEIDKVEPQIHYITEGSSPSKSNRQKTLAETKTWQTIVCVTANGRIQERMAKDNTYTDADVVRVFEIFVEKRGPSTSGNEVRTMVAALSYNFGHVGLSLARYLGTNCEALRTRGRQLDAEVELAVAPYAPEERFWKAVVVTTTLAAEVANEILGKPVFHRDEIWKFMIKSYLDNRAFVKSAVRVGGSLDKAEDVMSKFLRERMNNQLWTEGIYVGKGKPPPLTILRAPPLNAGKGNPVFVHWSVDTRIVRISKNALSEFLTSIKVTPHSMIETIVKHFGGKILTRKNLTGGVSGERVHSGPPETILEIPVPPGSFFEPSLLSASTQIVTAPVSTPVTP